MKAPRRQLRLLLASASPRRKRLLKEAGFAFTVVRPDIDERVDPHLTLGEVTIWNALRKGVAVARRHPEAVVLAADTLVALPNEVIGKPADMKEARHILRRLNGREHVVISGVFIGCLADRAARVFRETSRVHFKWLSERELDRYLSEVRPLDKAGAYAAQGPGGRIIRRIDGSRSNVVGLPMERTTRELARFGIRPGKPSESRPASPTPGEAAQVRASKRGRGTRR